ncbi:hypothetical protein F4808DRAFT_291347 [Astrocystis sublimbata]|nr:hypothetical protein F4808DRAFT_291347 [Astrocystis sublimbata]
MFLKRKRSESELSTSTSSTFNSPPRFGSISPQSLDIYTNISTNMNADPFAFAAMTNAPPSPLARFGNRGPGRTMKRIRDNRPSENEVHQRTLGMLYAAQRQQSSHEATANQTQQHAPIAAQPGTSSSLSSQKTNLHNFWALPSRPSAPPTTYHLSTSTTDTPSACEDCGRGFGNDNYGDDDGMMDIDMDEVSGEENVACAACGKCVCSHCSITNINTGDQRRCLSCAGTNTRGDSAHSMASGNPWARSMSNWLR